MLEEWLTFSHDDFYSIIEIILLHSCFNQDKAINSYVMLIEEYFPIMHAKSQNLLKVFARNLSWYVAILDLLSELWVFRDPKAFTNSSTIDCVAIADMKMSLLYIVSDFHFYSDNNDCCSCIVQTELVLFITNLTAVEIS